MGSFASRRRAATLALRWHAPSAALVVCAAALTLIGSIPALLALGGTTAAPTLSLALGSTAALQADWGGAGVVWPQLQQLALMQLFGIVRGGVLLTGAIGAATVMALHLARSSARSGEVMIARAVGASRRDVLGATLLEAAALSAVALSVGATIGGVAAAALRAGWPGEVGASDLSAAIAASFAVAALIMAGPLLLTRALTARRLVDDDRRPLTLIIPAFQLGGSLVVLASGVMLHSALESRPVVTSADSAEVMVQPIRATGSDRLRRAQGLLAALTAHHAAHPSSLISVTSSGAHRGLGTSADVIADCGDCQLNGLPVRYRSETAWHAAVSGDTFALSNQRILAGRAFSDSDRWDAPLVTVIGSRMARDLFEDGSAVGRHIKLGLLDDRWFRVVGVVDDPASGALGASLQPPYAVYVSVLQHPVAELEIGTRYRAALAAVVVRAGVTVGSAQSLVSAAERESRVLRWFTRLLSGMGVIAAAIAIGGLLVMLQLWLDSQRAELGVHRAVGARRRDVVRMVLQKAALVCGSGTLFGAWLGLIAWDVLPRVVTGAPVWEWRVVLGTGLGLSVLTLVMATGVAVRFTRTPVNALLNVA